MGFAGSTGQTTHGASGSHGTSEASVLDASVLDTPEFQGASFAHVRVPRSQVLVLSEMALDRKEKGCENLRKTELGLQYMRDVFLTVGELACAGDLASDSVQQ